MKTKAQIKKQILVLQGAHSGGRGETDDLLKEGWETLRWVLDEDEVTYQVLLNGGLNLETTSLDRATQRKELLLERCENVKIKEVRT